MAELNVNDISISTINPTDKVFGFSSTESKAPTVKKLLSAAPGVMATGTCATAASTALKEVTSSDWVGSPGQSIIIEFSTENTADDITISINQGTAIAVYALNSSLRLGAGAIPAGAMIFTLNADGTKFYAHTDVVSKSDFQIKHADGSIKYFGKTSQDGFINTITNANLAIPPKENSKANFILLDNNTNTPDTSKYWQIECITYGINGTPPTQYFEQTARALGQGTVLEYIRSGSLSNSYSSSVTVIWGSWQKITPSTSIASGSTDPVTSNAINTALSGKQATLVSGTNIKTVAGTSLLGSGNIAVATMSGANAGAVCTTAKGISLKQVTIDGFTEYEGVTIKVMFQNGNGFVSTQNSGFNPLLKVGSNGNAYPILVPSAGTLISPKNHTGYWRGASSFSTEMWQPYTTLELMLVTYSSTISDTSYTKAWVVMGNPVVESWYSSTAGYTVFADGLIVQWGKTSAAPQNLYVYFESNTSYIILSDNPANKNSSLAMSEVYYPYSKSQISKYNNSESYSIMWFARGY